MRLRIRRRAEAEMTLLDVLLTHARSPASPPAASSASRRGARWQLGERRLDERAQVRVIEIARRRDDEVRRE